MGGGGEGGLKREGVLSSPEKGGLIWEGVSLRIYGMTFWLLVQMLYH